MQGKKETCVMKLIEEETFLGRERCGGVHARRPLLFLGPTLGGSGERDMMNALGPGEGFEKATQTIKEIMS